MPSYWRLKYDVPAPEERTRIIQNLEGLRRQISEEMPRLTATETLVLGTWNIRNFDDNRFGHGPRSTEAFYYLAEVVSRFDILAVQEINRELAPLDRLLKILGPGYQYIVTDVAEGTSGNTERLGFIYNTHKVTFDGVAGEIVLPDRLLISDVTQGRQFARTPFACSFRSGWFKFAFATVHIYYGKESKSSPEYARRLAEIDAVARFLAKRAKDEDYNYILVGDFNIEDFDSKTFDALRKHGFEIFRNKIGSNAKQTKFYDQISFKARENELRFADSGRARGVLDIFQRLYNEDQFEAYEEQVRDSVNGRLAEEQSELEAAIAKLSKWKIAAHRKAIASLESLLASPAALRNYYIDEWRTFQLSDHLPLWVEVEIDFSADYLKHLKSFKSEPRQ